MRINCQSRIRYRLLNPMCGFLHLPVSKLHHYKATYNLAGSQVSESYSFVWMHIVDEYSQVYWILPVLPRPCVTG